MVKAASDLLRCRKLACRALMTELAARLPKRRFRALASQRAALLTRQRQIPRRRQRAVRQVTAQTPLKLLDALKQPRHLADLLQQGDDKLPCGLPARQRDRFGLHIAHKRNIPCTQKESCSRLRPHLNAYDVARHDRPIAAALRIAEYERLHDEATAGGEVTRRVAEDLELPLPTTGVEDVVEHEGDDRERPSTRAWR